MSRYELKSKSERS